MSPRSCDGGLVLPKSHVPCLYNGMVMTCTSRAVLKTSRMKAVIMRTTQGTLHRTRLSQKAGAAQSGARAPPSTCQELFQTGRDVSQGSSQPPAPSFCAVTMLLRIP